MTGTAVRSVTQVTTSPYKLSACIFSAFYVTKIQSKEKIENKRNAPCACKSSLRLMRSNNPYNMKICMRESNKSVWEPMERQFSSDKKV